MKLLLRFALIFTFFVFSIQDVVANINTSSFLENTTPPILGTLSGPTNVCLNSTNQVVTFTGSGGTAPYTFTYTINGGPNLTISSLGTSDFVTLIIPTSTSGPISYNLASIHDSVAPTVEIQQTNVSLTITILDLPLSTITTTTSTIFCEENSVILTANTGSGMTYVWKKEGFFISI